MQITIPHQTTDGVENATVMRVAYVPNAQQLIVMAGFGPQTHNLPDDHPLALALEAFVKEKYPG